MLDRRRIALIFCSGLSGLFLTGAGGNPTVQPLYHAYNAAQSADLDKVSAYLNAIHTLKSDFVQIGPDGSVVQGVLYIEKPGRIRFEYNPPSPLLIVATGGTVYVKNSRLNTVDKYDLSDTPLGLLLNKKIDLKNNNVVQWVQEQPGSITIFARSSSNRSNSNITLVFSAPNIELRQWTVKDNQGGLTTVALQNTQIDVPLAENLFSVPVKDDAPGSKQGN